MLKKFTQEKSKKRTKTRKMAKKRAKNSQKTTKKKAPKRWLRNIYFQRFRCPLQVLSQYHANWCFCPKYSSYHKCRNDKKW